MTRLEWTTIEQGLRSCRTARCSLSIVLVGLGILSGIGLGIPIGREQQARVNARPVNRGGDRVLARGDACGIGTMRQPSLDCGPR